MVRLVFTYVNSSHCDELECKGRFCQISSFYAMREPFGAALDNAVAGPRCRGNQTARGMCGIPKAFVSGAERM